MQPLNLHARVRRTAAGGGVGRVCIRGRCHRARWRAGSLWPPGNAPRRDVAGLGLHRRLQGSKIEEAWWPRLIRNQFPNVRGNVTVIIVFRQRGGGAPTVATMYGREHQSPAAALAAAHRLASRCDLSVLPPLAPRRPPLGGMYAQGGGSGSWGPRASHELPMMGRLWPKRTDGGDGASGCLSCLDSVVWDLQGHRGCVRVQQPSCIRRGSPAPL